MGVPARGVSEHGTLITFGSHGDPLDGWVYCNECKQGRSCPWSMSDRTVNAGLASVTRMGNT